MRTVINVLAAFCLVLLSCLIGMCRAARPAMLPDLESAPSQAVVSDAGGHPVPVADYRRIACISPIAAQVLPDLVASERIIMVGAWHDRYSPLAFRTPDRQIIESLDSIEVLIAAQPDLVIINHLGISQSVVDQLRAQGLQVLDLGPMLGFDSLQASIALLGAVLDQEQRAAALARSLKRRLHQVAAHVGDDQQRRAVYLGTHGGRLMGGTIGSAYHDLLRFAGLIDVAAEAGFTGWPSYSAEDLYRLDPAVIVTQQDMVEALRTMPALAGLRALTDRDGLLVLPRHFDPTGPRLLDYCEMLNDMAYGDLVPDHEAPP